MSWIKLLLPLLGASLAHASLSFDVNAVMNPGAELGAGGLFNNSIVPVPFWTGTGSFTVTQYTDSVNSVPRPEDPGPPDRGLNFFSGGPDEFNPFADNHSTGDQFLDVSDQSGAIDAGGVSFLLSGWLGGWFTQTDEASFSAIFEGDAANVLGTTSIGPVTAADRNFTTGLYYRSIDGLIPEGTRTIDFHLTMDLVQGGHNDGYADNLSFVASQAIPDNAVPEPGSAGMLGLALAIGLAALRLRTAPLARKVDR
jgi:hypothetical protein